VSTFVDSGVSRGQRGGTPTAVNLSFLDRSRYFIFQITPHLFSRDLVDLVPDPLLLRNCDCARESNPGPLGQQPGALSTQIKSTQYEQEEQRRRM
jgi:hypothetical protein